MSLSWPFKKITKYLSDIFKEMLNYEIKQKWLFKMYSSLLQTTLFQACAFIL